MKRDDDNPFAELVLSVQGCRLCEASLPMGPRPVFQIDPQARILIAGQAPGRRVHETGVPFDDPSGERLRDWLGVSRDVFYDATQIAILPMGFCYPGTGKSGDLPPRPECEKAWRTQLMGCLDNVRLTIVIGQYAQKWHLTSVRRNLTETVRAWQDYGTGVIPLPHPSPRNNIWIKKIRGLWIICFPRFGNRSAMHLLRTTAIPSVPVSTREVERRFRG